MTDVHADVLIRYVWERGGGGQGGITSVTLDKYKDCDFTGPCAISGVGHVVYRSDSD